jgi:hypothetical protein
MSSVELYRMLDSFYPEMPSLMKLFCFAHQRGARGVDEVDLEFLITKIKKKMKRSKSKPISVKRNLQMSKFDGKRRREEAGRSPVTSRAVLWCLRKLLAKSPPNTGGHRSSDSSGLALTHQSPS